MAKPWEKYQQQGPGMDPRIANEVAASQYEAPQAQANLQNTQAAIGRTNALTPAQVRKAEADARLAEAKAAEVESGKQKQTAETRSKAMKGFQDTRLLDQAIQEIEVAFESGAASTPALLGLLDFFPTEANQKLDDAGNSTRALVKGVLQFTGQENNTPRESEMNFGPYIPQSSNFDGNIQSKIDRLKRLRDNGYERVVSSLGGVPDGRGGVVPLPDGVAPTAANIASMFGQQPPSPQEAVNAVENRISDQTQQRMVDGGGSSVAPSQGEYETVDNPELAGLNDEVMGMLLGGKSTNEIAAHIKSRGVNPLPMLGAIDANVKIQKTNPGVKPRIDLDNMSREISQRQQINNYMLDSKVGAAATGYGNTMTAGTLDEIIGGNTQQTKEYLRSQYPGSSFAGELGGGVTAMLPIGRGVQAGAKALGASKLANSAVASGVVGDAAFGAAYGAGENNDNRLTGAAIGGGSAALGSAGGAKLAGMFGRGTRGVSDPSVNKLNNAGVPMTLGQIVGEGGIVGRSMKAMEDGLESVPVLGSAIRNRRESGMEKFNQAAFDEALQPIGKNVPSVGPQGIEQAKAATSEGYKDALGGVSIAPDSQFAQDMVQANNLGSTTPDFGPQYTNIMERKLAPIARGGDQIDGEQFQKLRRAAEGYSRKYDKVANGPTPQPMAEDVATAFSDVTGALDGLVGRTNPDVLPAYQAANKSYGNVMTLKDAVSRSRNGTRSGEAGIFAPSQLNDAAESTAKKFGNRGGTTQRPFYELGEAGQKVLPSNIGNSGTVDRALATAALPAALGGAGYATGLVEPETAALIAGAGLPFTKTGQQITQKALLARPEKLKQLGEEIIRRRRIGGMFGGAAMIPQVNP